MAAQVLLASLGGDLARVRQQVLQILAVTPHPGPLRANVPDSSRGPRGGRCDALLSTSACYRTLEVAPGIAS